ncbi:MAG: TRAP transporter substrate-binding protein DctP, partial [Chloroflexi bacterium]|nr:TRAP transporter substrate-binding protein DctP [Chloroflexota bacterium]
LDMQEQTLTGTPQIAQVDPGYAAAAGGVPEMNVLYTPFLFDDIEDVNAVLDSDLMQEWVDELKKGGLHSITWDFYFGERHIIANEGYPQPEDLEGVKIRVPPNPAWVATFKALKTSPVTLEFSEIYTGLQQGVVEAAESPFSSLKASSLYEVADTVTLTSHFKAISGWATSVEFWESLPPEYQEIITEEFAAGAEFMTETTLEQEDVLRAEFEDELGVTLVEPDIEAYREAAQPFYDAFPEFREGLQEQLLEIMGR